MNFNIEFKKFFAALQPIALNPNRLKILAALIPVAIAFYLYNPFDNVFTFYWDQTILLQDKNIFNSSFYFFQERFGFGVYGYYLNYIVYSIFSFIFGPERGVDVMMIALVQAAFWGAFLFLKEVTKNTSNFNIYLLALIYIISIEAQMNVYRTILGQNFLWGFLPLACYFTLKVVKENGLKWQLALASTLFFLQVSFAHPTSIINYALVISLTLLLSLVYTRFNLAKISKVVAINIVVFIPILLQILLINREVSSYIYNSSNAFGGDFILSWYELGKARFNLNNILKLDYFLESQIRTDSYSQESLLRLANAKINNVFGVYAWLSYFNLGLFVIILLPLFQKLHTTQIKNWIAKFRSHKNLNQKIEVVELKKEGLESNIPETQDNSKVKLYAITSLAAMFGVATMGMFQGPLLQFFGLIYKIVPSVFLLYRYLDAKFGIIFILLILLAISSAYTLIKTEKLKLAVNIFLLVINIFYLGFFSTQYFVSPYGQVELAPEYSQTCDFLKNNSFRTIKFPYSYDFLHFTNISNKQVLSNDIFNQNCSHSVLSIRTLPSEDENSIIKLYDLMATNPSQFQERIESLSIDTILVDKQFIPNYSWYRITSEEEKNSLIQKIDDNYKDNKIFENSYFTVYKFKQARSFYVSSGSLNINKINPTHYNLQVNNISKNATLEFQYSFGSWNLTEPNQKYLLSDSIFNHYKGRGFNNTWDINFSELEQNCSLNYCQKNEDGTYNLSLELWYKPQVVFEEIMAIYAIVLLSFVIYKWKNKFYGHNK